VVALAIEQPAFTGGQRVRQRGLVVSAAGVRRVWLRHDLETMMKRLKALGPGADRSAGGSAGEGEGGK
jgi:hypothetical protein